MQITVIGTGYVGLVTGACLADMGNKINCLDIDKDKIKTLKQGKLPFFEPDLEQIVKYNLREKRLNFVSQAKEAIKKAQVIFIAVGTPPKKDGSPDLSYIYSAAKTIGKFINNYKVIATKSTVPVGTNEAIEKIIKKTVKKATNFSIVSNPEFLREGNAVKDFYNPDRIVLGFNKQDKNAKEIMLQIYRAITRSEKPVLLTNLRTAEAIKYAANAFLATKISFINEIANFCEKIKANIDDVAKGIGLDQRIGSKFLQAGLGYGGSCFPKDVKALIEMGKKHNYQFRIIDATEKVNQKQKLKILTKLYQKIKNFNGKSIAIWGLSFKPNTDDIREAPSIIITQKLLNDFPKITINVFDPQAGANFKKIFNQKNVIRYKNMYDALKNTWALLILTDWDEFKFPDFSIMKKLMRNLLIVDGRNLYDPKQVKKTGFRYLSIGRK